MRPARLTREWKTLYPESLVLKKQGERESSYEEGNRDPSRIGIFGRRLKDYPLLPKERILGVRYGDAATAFVLQRRSAGWDRAG